MRLSQLACSNRPVDARNKQTTNQTNNQPINQSIFSVCRAHQETQQTTIDKHVTPVWGHVARTTWLNDIPITVARPVPVVAVVLMLGPVLVTILSVRAVDGTHGSFSFSGSAILWPVPPVTPALHLL